MEEREREIEGLHPTSNTDNDVSNPKWKKTDTAAYKNRWKEF